VIYLCLCVSIYVKVVERGFGFGIKILSQTQTSHRQPTLYKQLNGQYSCVSHMEKLVFEVENNDFVKLGDASYNIRLSHKIDPSSFIEIFDRIADNFHFWITEELYKRISIRETTWHGKKTKA